MKLEITEDETIWYIESCGSFDCALRLENGKYAAFNENDEGFREFVDGEEFDTPTQAVDAARFFFS